jgi:hypothetical protein
MAAKRWFGIIVPFVLLVSCASAQMNELSVTAGRTFVSTQTVENPPANDLYPRIHFGNEESVAFNYGRFLMQRKIFGITAELPVAIYFRMDLNTGANQIPKDIGALFATPSVRVNMFARDSVTPWVSVGGGYGRFRQAPTLNFYGPNPGPTSENTGVLQLGTGLDVWFWERWGGRLEARDFYSGEPALNAETNRTRQHNFYVGVGIMHRF